MSMVPLNDALATSLGLVIQLAGAVGAWRLLRRRPILLRAILLMVETIWLGATFLAGLIDHERSLVAVYTSSSLAFGFGLAVVAGTIGPILERAGARVPPQLGDGTESVFQFVLLGTVALVVALTLVYSDLPEPFLVAAVLAVNLVIYLGYEALKTAVQRRRR